MLNYTPTNLLVDIVLLIMAILFMIGSILIPKSLKNRNLISKLTARKLIHSFGGLTILFAPFFSYPFYIIGVAFFILLSYLILKFSSPKSRFKLFRELFSAVSEEEEERVNYLQGPFLYSLTITIQSFIFLFFHEWLYIAIASILIMMYADTAASYIGKKIGRHSFQFPWLKHKRTFEGSLFFLIIAFACAFGTFFIFGFLNAANLLPLSIAQTLLLSLILSLITTGAEAMSPSKYDDLIVPICGSLLLITLFFYFVI
jgi:dolichol kinase